MKIKRSKGDLITDGIIATIMIITMIVCLYPIWFTIIASFSDPIEIVAGRVLLLPSKFTLAGYESLLEHASLLRGYRNTVLYMFGGTFMMLAVTLPVGYALSKRKLPGRLAINTFFILTMYFSGGLLPTFVLHSSIGWVDTPWVLLVPSCMAVYNMILFRSACDAMPSELYEAAIMDGCNDFRYFFTFSIPLCKATIAVLFLFGALSWWNEYMRFSIYIRTPALQTVQVTIRQVVNNISTAVDPEVATSEELAEIQRKTLLLRYSTITCVSLPFIIIYPFVQRYFNQGVMLGAVKG